MSQDSWKDSTGKFVKMKYDPEKIIEWLMRSPSRFFGPTKIGMEVFGLDYGRASSAIMPAIRKLLQEGKVVRDARGRYRAKT